DPVKRATWVGALLVGALAVWSGYLQVRLMAATSEANRYESEWRKLESAYKKVTADMEAAAESERKWSALQTLATNRFLWANPLNALQFAMVTVDDVQITALKTSQSYAITEAVKPTTNSTSGIVSRGKPGTSKEKVAFNLDGKDTSKEAKDSAKDSAKRSTDGVFKLQEAINNYPYFKTNQVRTQLITRPPDQIGPNNQRFSTFTLGCEFPEITR